MAVSLERWPMRAPLKIAGYTFNEFQFVVVTVFNGISVGRGEAAGVYYLGDTAASICTRLESVRATVEHGVTRAQLQSLLPPGGARNALDCALWDLESKQTARPVWQLAGLSTPAPLITTHTLSADHPDVMARGCRELYRDATAIKLKLMGDDQDAARVQVVRAARPDVWLGVDANQSLEPATFAALLPSLLEARVELIEQPFKRGEEFRLEGLESPIPIAADESVQSLADLPGLLGRCNVINIKLDKCGGLTEALRMAREGRRLGFKIMVGNMGGTSLAMAPAALVGQYCDIVDLDGPLFLAADREHRVLYNHGRITVPPHLWGCPANRDLA
jgi:L-Ala-D/L-Glu epimerase